MIDRIFTKINLPHGVLNFLPGPGGVVGDTLVTHPDMAIIAFTGSKEVGEKGPKTSALIVINSRCKVVQKNPLKV